MPNKAKAILCGAALLAAAGIAAGARPAAAQAGAPCAPLYPTPWNQAYIQQQQAVCRQFQQQLAVQRQQLEQQQAYQRQQQEQQRAYQRQQQEQQAAAERRRQREDAEARARVEAELSRAAAQAKAIADFKRAAESDPNNKCAVPRTARQLIQNYNDLTPWRQAVDIEHLVTLEPDGKTFLVCHGEWVLNDGVRLEGTMRYRLNVAGDAIYGWKPESWTPNVSDIAGQARLLPGLSRSFDTGFADRSTWEEWVSTTSGDFRTGVEYWAGERGKPEPGACGILGGGAERGCEAAKARIAMYDGKRMSDPDYRRGWNSY